MLFAGAFCHAHLDSGYAWHPHVYSIHCPPTHTCLFFCLFFSMSVIFSCFYHLYLPLPSLDCLSLCYFNFSSIPWHQCWPSFVFLLFSVDPVPLPLHLPFFSGLGWTCCVFGCQVSMGLMNLIWIKCSACPPPPLSGAMRALCPSGRSSAAWRWVRTQGLFQPQVCVNVSITQEDYHNAVVLKQGPGPH